MKLKAKEAVYSVKPKQSEGKLLVRVDRYTVKPKHGGAKIYENQGLTVLKMDRRCGVKIQKNKAVKILKQWD